MLLILFSQLFSWAVQDRIIPLNNLTSTLDLHQDCLRFLRDYLSLLDLHPFGHHLLVQYCKVAPLAPRPLLHFFSRRSPYFCSRRSMGKLILLSWESSRLRPGNLISCYCSIRWLIPKLSLIELRVLPIAPPPRLIIAFICRALRFLFTPPLVTKKVLIYW